MLLKYLCWFLLLMVRHVNSIECHQISNTIEEKISVLKEQIIRFSTQVKEDQFISLIISTKNEKIKNILSEIDSKVNGICFSCIEVTWNRDCIGLRHNVLFYKYLCASIFSERGFFYLLLLYYSL